MQPLKQPILTVAPRTRAISDAWTVRTSKGNRTIGSVPLFARSFQVLRVLTRCDFRARYRAQALGVLWSLLNPIVMMGILSLIFTRGPFRVTTPNFPIFILIGLITWQWISASVSASTQVFVGQAELIKRTVFPRTLLPASTVLSYGINFCVECLALLAFIPKFPDAFRFTPALLVVPLLLGLLLILLFGIALMTSVLNVIYRDVAYLVNTGLLLLYWLSPIIYETDKLDIPPVYRKMLALNPICGVLTGLRNAIMRGQVPSLYGWAEMVAPIAVVLVIGWIVYRHYERMVLDYV